MTGWMERENGGRVKGMKMMTIMSGRERERGKFLPFLAQIERERLATDENFTI
jgi:hypothetical protein